MRNKKKIVRFFLLFFFTIIVVICFGCNKPMTTESRKGTTMHLSGGTLIMHEKLISQQRKDVFERMNKNYEK